MVGPAGVVYKSFGPHQKAHVILNFTRDLRHSHQAAVDSQDVDTGILLVARLREDFAQSRDHERTVRILVGQEVAAYARSMSGEYEHVLPRVPIQALPDKT